MSFLKCKCQTQHFKNVLYSSTRTMALLEETLFSFVCVYCVLIVSCYYKVFSLFADLYIFYFILIIFKTMKKLLSITVETDKRGNRKESSLVFFSLYFFFFCKNKRSMGSLTFLKVLCIVKLRKPRRLNRDLTYENVNLRFNT